MQIQCPQCSTRLAFEPKAAVSVISCPKCSTQMRVEAPASAPAPQPVVPAAPPDPNKLQSGPLAGFDIQDFDPPSPAAAPSFQSSPPRSTAVPYNQRALESSRDGAKVGRTLLYIFGGLLAAAGSIVVVGLAIFAVMGAVPQSKQTITLGGWSADAPGSKTYQGSKLGLTGRGVVHLTTGSEFGLMTNTSNIGALALGIDDIVESMSRSAGVDIRNITKVTRAGMEGVRFRAKTPTAPWATMEVFKVDSTKIVLMTYITGTSKREAGLRGPKRSVETEERLDDPEAFFNSLRRAK